VPTLSHRDALGFERQDLSEPMRLHSFWDFSESVSKKKSLKGWDENLEQKAAILAP
jgi:hypothetical protein